MKMGIILPSCIYNLGRAHNAKLAFEALIRTQTGLWLPKPRLHLLLKMGVDFYYPLAALQDVFDLTLEGDPAGVTGVEQTLAYGTTKLFNEGMDYVSWIQDDTLVHPRWLLQLEGLIQRHPQAKAWSVYRSANEATHKVLKIEENGDVLVSSIGHAMTIARQEWIDWGVPWQDVNDTGGYAGITMDLVHPQTRPGERWVTGVSYADHIGKIGVHCQPHIPEHAVLFQGRQND